MSEYYVGRYTVCQGCIFSILTMGNIIFIAFGKNMVKNRKKSRGKGRKRGKGKEKGGKRKKSSSPRRDRYFPFFFPPEGLGGLG